MSTGLAQPLIPPHVDVRTFDYMPLNVQRILNSDLLVDSTGDEFKAAVILWCRAWHQVPAGSLPNDDAKLAYMSGFGRDVRGWRRVKAGALRGFFLCSDGRIYHPVICDTAMTSYAKSETAKANIASRWQKSKSLENNNTQNTDTNSKAYPGSNDVVDSRGHTDGHSEQIPKRYSEQNRTEQNRISSTTTTESGAAREPSSAQKSVAQKSTASKISDTKPAGTAVAEKPHTVVENKSQGSVQVSKITEISDLIWTSFGKGRELEGYRASGAVNDKRMVNEWLKRGFTEAEIRAALDHLTIRVADVQNPVNFAARVLPDMIERKRATGEYNAPRISSGGAGAQNAGSSATQGLDMTEQRTERLKTQRMMGLIALENFVRKKNSWPPIYGPPPGKAGSVITKDELEEMQIACGVNNGD